MRTRFFRPAVFLLPLFFLLSPREAFPAGEEKPAVGEKSYFGAVVLLIDYEKGLLGVQWEDEGGSAKKVGLRANPKEVYVTNFLNQYLEFSDIRVGDLLDIYTKVSPEGEEIVDEIWDYNQFARR